MFTPAHTAHTPRKRSGKTESQDDTLLTSNIYSRRDTHNNSPSVLAVKHGRNSPNRLQASYSPSPDRAPTALGNIVEPMSTPHFPLLSCCDRDRAVQMMLGSRSPKAVPFCPVQAWLLGNGNMDSWVGFGPIMSSKYNKRLCLFLWIIFFKMVGVQNKQ